MQHGPGLQLHQAFIAQMYKFQVEKYIFTNFAYEFFSVKMKYCK